MLPVPVVPTHANWNVCADVLAMADVPEIGAAVQGVSIVVANVPEFVIVPTPDVTPVVKFAPIFTLPVNVCAVAELFAAKTNSISHDTVPPDAKLVGHRYYYLKAD